MSPPPKKQKLQEGPEHSPIVFQAPGLQPDIRLKVFDDEFIAHSQILKLYSTFFRKFLDSPDKQTDHDAQGPDCSTGGSGHADSGKYKYEWITQVDDDDTWSLVAASNSNKQNPESPAYTGDKKEAASAIERLLCAMYMKPYEIKDTDDLQSIVTQADYYLALPVLSRSLGSVLLQSRDFVRNIAEDAVRIHQLAAKLRHEVLFRDSLMFLIGSWEQPRYQLLTSTPLLLENAKKRYHDLAAYILETQNNVLNEVLFGGDRDLNSRTLFHMMQDAKYDKGDTFDEANIMTVFFRYISENGEIEGLSQRSIDKVNALLENTTTLCQYRTPGEYREDSMCIWFLCSEKITGTLPWDPEEVDW